MYSSVMLYFFSFGLESSVPEEFFTGIADAYADNLETLVGTAQVDLAAIIM